MSQNVTVHMGGFGCRAGLDFYDRIVAERAWTPGEDINESAHFVEMQYGLEGDPQRRWIPRAVFADAANGAVDSVRNRLTRNHVTGRGGAALNIDSDCVELPGESGGNIAGRGMYNVAEGARENFMNSVRRQAEGANELNGVSLFHALAGGTGAGFGTTMLAKIRENYPGARMLTYSLLPTIAASGGELGDGTTVAPYNVVLAFQQLIENSDHTMLFSNSALTAHADAQAALAPPVAGVAPPVAGDGAIQSNTDERERHFAAANGVFTRCVAGVEGLLRYRGATGAAGSTRDLATLSPYPRMHFLEPHLITAADIVTAATAADGGAPLSTEAAIAGAAYSGGTSLLGRSPASSSETTLFASMVVARLPGPASSALCLPRLVSAVHRQASTMQQYRHVVDAGKTRAFTAADTAAREASAVSLVNSRDVADALQPIAEQFTALFRRKAFLHWYTGEGMDEMEFTEAESNLNDLITELRPSGSREDEDDDSD